MVRQLDDDFSADESVTFNLPAYERDVIVTSQHVDSAIQKRIREAPPREPLVLAFEELEDLHRGLAYDIQHTNDKKRAKTVGKVLQKIDELLELYVEDDEDAAFMDDDESLSFSDIGNPGSPQEVFENIFAPAISARPARGPQYRLALDASHRQTLIDLDTVPGDIQKLIAAAPQNVPDISLDYRQFMMLTFAVQGELGKLPDDGSCPPVVEIAQRMSEAMFEAYQLEAAVEDDEEDEFSVSSDYRRQQQCPTIAYELTITLDESQPSIWRRLRIGDCTLDVLHEIVQRAMGWENYHCHTFEWKKLRFGRPNPDFEMDEIDERQVLLSKLVQDGCKQLRYWYDFGDDWWHTIKIGKKTTPKPSDRFPICVEGAGACPPEDCGGLWGYYELLEALRDPKHKRHEELSEWAGDVDSDHFDLNAVNRALAV